MVTVVAPARSINPRISVKQPAPAAKTRSFGGRLRLYLNIYRAVALALAASQLSSFNSSMPLPAGVVILGAAVYTGIRFITPIDSKNAWRGQAFLAIDLVFCGLLVWLTGGINSPFLLYTLAPVLSASLFYSQYMASSVAIASSLYILLAQLANPFYTLSPGPFEISYFFIYVVAVSLSASLPYLVNINLHQRLQGEFIAEERQRLSREIHDGTVQTLSAISWQGQIIERELDKLGISHPEVDKMLRLVEDARLEALESLELLRRYSGAGPMINHLKNYLNHLKQDVGIDYHLSLPQDSSSMPPHIEMQLLRICQEAMNNTRKHACAKHIALDMTRKDSRVLVTIQDDGVGFDVGNYYHGRIRNGHGLNVMKERAESVGGSLMVVSVPGQGTTLKIDIPLNRS